MSKSRGRSVPALLFFALALLCSLVQEAFAAAPFEGRKVLFVDSYHRGYPWSDGVLRGLRQALDGSGVTLRVVEMDTKRRQHPDLLEKAGELAQAARDEFKPDVVVASDDNAQRFFVVPFLKNSGTPVVFCGVNQDASPYGYPTDNVTGMVEVEAVETLVGNLRRLGGGGDRVAFVCDDSETQRKVAASYNQRLFNGRLLTFFARTMDELKRLFLEAQEAADVVLFENYAAINDFDPNEAESFLLANVKRPTGSSLDFMSRYVALTVAKSPEEQGLWAGKAALEILGGKPPRDIPLATNEQTLLTVNLKMAQAAGLVVPVDMLRAASAVIGQEAVEGRQRPPQDGAGRDAAHRSGS